MVPDVQAKDGYVPRASPLFRPVRIVLAKGSNRTEARRRFAARIREVYPEAEVVEAFDTPHNRVDLGVADPPQVRAVEKMDSMTQRIVIDRKSAIFIPFSSVYLGATVFMRGGSIWSSWVRSPW